MTGSLYPLTTLVHSPPSPHPAIAYLLCEWAQWVVLLLTQVRQNSQLSHWPDGATGWTLRMGRATVWDFRLGTIANRNMVCKDPRLPAGSSASLLHQSDFQRLTPTDFPSDLPQVRPNWASRKLSPNARVSGSPPWAAFSLWSNWRP